MDTGTEVLVVSLDVVVWANFLVVVWKSPLIMGEEAEVQHTRVVRAFDHYWSVNQEYESTVMEMTMQNDLWQRFLQKGWA